MDRKSDKNTLLFDSRFMSVIFFICSIMVVGIHSYNAGSLPSNHIASYIEGFFCHGLFVAAVPIFFYLSGYLFFRNIDIINDVFKKMKTRTKSVLMPFLAWSSLYFLFYLVASSLISGLLNDPILLDPLSIVKYIIFYRYSFALWYMHQLIMFVLLTPIIYIVMKKRWFAVSLLVICCVFSVFVEDSIDIVVLNGNSRSLFQFNFFGYYLAGCLSVKFIGEVNKIKECIFRNKKLTLIITAVLLIVFSFLSSLAFDEIVPVFYKRIFVPIVAILLFIVVGLIYQKFPYPKQVSTMIVYGVHTLVGICLSFVYTPISPYLPKLAMFCISFAITSVLSCLIAYTLKRYFKPIYFVLSGGR